MNTIETMMLKVYNLRGRLNYRNGYIRRNDCLLSYAHMIALIMIS